MDNAIGSDCAENVPTYRRKTLSGLDDWLVTIYLGKKEKEMAAARDWLADPEYPTRPQSPLICRRWGREAVASAGRRPVYRTKVRPIHGTWVTETGEAGRR